MKINKMDSDYFVVCDDLGNTLAVVNMHLNKENPSISFSTTISFWDVKDVIWQIEEYLKHPW